MPEFDPNKNNVSQEGIKFLKKNSVVEHTEPEIERSAEKQKSGQKPEDKIEDYIETVQTVLQPEQKADGTIDRGERNLALLQEHKEQLYEEYGVITSDEKLRNNTGYWRSQVRIAEQQGRLGELPTDENGEPYIPEETKEQHIQTIQEEQRESFDSWVNYIASSDSNYIPSWAIVWALKGVLQSGKYDYEKGEFRKRDKKSTEPYPELNQEALAQCVDALQKKWKTEKSPKTIPIYRKLFRAGVFGSCTERIWSKPIKSWNSIWKTPKDTG